MVEFNEDKVKIPKIKIEMLCKGKNPCKVCVFADMIGCYRVVTKK